jgi:hypothetical protein
VACTCDSVGALNPVPTDARSSQSRRGCQRADSLAVVAAPKSDVVS